MNQRVRCGKLLPTLSLLAVGLLAFSGTAMAATWNGPDLTGTWDTTATNWSGVTGTPWAAVGNTALFGTSGNTANVSGTVYATVVQVDSSSNVVNVTGGATVNQTVNNARLYLQGTGHTGSALGNTVNVSTPGTLAAPSYILNGGSVSIWVGGDYTASTTGTTYSYNSLNLTNGAYFKITAGSGTNNSYIGASTGSNYNSMLIRGVDGSNNPTTFNNGGQRLYVGGYGSNNSLTVDQGGQALLRVLHVGAGGSNNTVTIAGASGVGPSFLKATEDVKIGDTLGSGVGAFNSIQVLNGGSFTSESRSSNNEFSLAVGTENGSNDNYLLVSGVGSLWTANKKSVIIGGAGTPSAVTPKPTALRNHIDIFAGATAAINTGVIVSGGSSAFNLGNGAGISSASVGIGTGVVNGISLSVTDARLNFNSGRLIAGANGALVSGLGKVELNGPAYVSTLFAGSTIDSVIEGTTSLGTLTKEGAGLLTLTKANTYVGLTTVSAGTLALGAAGSIDSSSGVKLDGGTFDVSAKTGGYTVASLLGNGSVTGNITTANLAIGASPGTVTFNNDLTLTGLSTFEINGFDPGLYDLALGGAGAQTVNYGGTLNLAFAPGFNTAGTVKIFEFENYTGNFTAVNSTGLASGLSASFDMSTGIVTVSAVPEPSTMALLIAGLLGLATYWRKRK